MPMNDGYTFAPFESWSHLLDAIKAGYTIYYHAPMDFRPHVVQVVVRRDGKLRVTSVFSNADPFTADENHLYRFERKVTK